MKLSLCNEVIRDLDFPRQCAFAATVGYDGLEIAPFTLKDDPLTLTPSEIAGVRSALEAEGLACSSLHWLLVAPSGLSITDPDPAVRGRTIEAIRRMIGLAAELDAPVLVHGSPKQRNLVEGEVSRGHAMRAFVAAAEAAEKAGVTYCLEALAPNETNFVNTVAEAAAIVDAIASPAFKTMLDACAAGQTEDDVPAVVDRFLASGHIAHVQLNDPNQRGPGEGDLPIAPIIQALQRHGYQGWLAAEPFDYRPDGPACAARAAGFLRGILEALR
jgi:D-psicose/D-tagatose/L-ribulose 3-epimerase